MLCKDFVQAVGLFQSPAQCIQILLIEVLNAGAAQTVHSGLIPLQHLLIAEHSGHILGSRQNSPHDCFAQGHLRCDMAVEKLYCHIAVIVQIADVGSSQPQQLCFWAEFQQLLYTFAPVLCPSPVELVHNNVGGVQQSNFRQFFRCAEHEFCIGIKVHMVQWEVWFLLVQPLNLGLENILAGRQPKYICIGVILDHLECDITFAGASGMDHGSFAVA